MLLSDDLYVYNVILLPIEFFFEQAKMRYINKSYVPWHKKCQRKQNKVTTKF